MSMTPDRKESSVTSLTPPRTPQLRTAEQSAPEIIPARPDIPASTVSYRSLEQSRSPGSRSPDRSRSISGAPSSERISPIPPSPSRPDVKDPPKRHHDPPPAESAPRPARHIRQRTENLPNIEPGIRASTVTETTSTLDCRSTTAAEDATAERIDRILGFLKTVEEDDAKSVATIKTNSGAMWGLDCMKYVATSSIAW